MPAGRPSKFTQELADEICRRTAKGETLLSITRSEHVPEAPTVYDWLKVHEDFAKKFAVAREHYLARMAEEITEIADDATNDFTINAALNGAPVLVDKDHIARSRLRIETRKWLLSKLAPKTFGDKVTQEVTGADGGPQEHVHRVERVIVRPANTDG